MATCSSTYLLKQVVAVIFMVAIAINMSDVNGCFTSIFSFGDSYADTGNFLYITLSESRDISWHGAFPPNGRTYFGFPTGRSCDGRLVIDFLADGLGLPLLQPYFAGKKNGRSRDFQKGVNFAVAGATSLDSAFLVERGVYGFPNISLGDEVGFFKDALSSLCSSSSDCKELLRTSLIVLGVMGGNDYSHSLKRGINFEEIRDWAPLVVHNIASTITEFIEYGAGTIVVTGIPPMGCMASYITLFPNSDKEQYDPLTGCLTWINEFGQYHNELLQKELDRIRKLHPTVNIVYANYYKTAIRFYNSPEQFGFKEILKACCGVGGGLYNFKPFSCCGDQGVRTSCDDPSLYVSWDGIHFTEAGYKWIAKAILKQLYPICVSSIVNKQAYIVI